MQTEKTMTYGSQRPVVIFTLACGQYEPSGQATRNKPTNRKLKAYWKILIDHEHNYLRLLKKLTQHASKTTGAEETLTTLLRVGSSWWNHAAVDVAE
jgi:hypothetical protein